MYTDRIEAIRRAMAHPSKKASAKDGGADPHMEVLEMLGEGSFGKVYKAMW